MILDEWAAQNHEIDTSILTEKVDLGIYVIEDQGLVVLYLIKDEKVHEGKQSNELWSLYFDGSRRKVGGGGGAMLVSPSGERYYSAFHFSLSYSNNY